MDILGLIALLLMFACGYALGVAEAMKRAKDARPYKWKCMKDDCLFKVEANNMNWVMNIAKVHEETKHDVL